MDFYKLGSAVALEKLGVLKELGGALKGAWGGLSGGAQQAAKRIGIGAGVGAAGGAIADTPGGALGGALAGGAMGYGAHRGLDYLKHKGFATGGKQLNLFGGAAPAAEQAATRAPQQMNLLG